MGLKYSSLWVETRKVQEVSWRLKIDKLGNKIISCFDHLFLFFLRLYLLRHFSIFIIVLVWILFPILFYTLIDGNSKWIRIVHTANNMRAKPGYSPLILICMKISIRFPKKNNSWALKFSQLKNILWYTLLIFYSVI